MPILLVNAILISIYSLVFRNITINKQKYMFLLFCFFNFVFVRTFVNIDSVLDLGGEYGYISDFNNIADSSWMSFKFYLLNVRYEPLFLLLAKICSLVTSDYRFFLFVCSVLSILPVLFIISRYSYNIKFSVLLFTLYFFTSSIFILRQFIAVPILFLSIKYITDRKLVKFLLFTLVAFLFHYSSIIWIGTYFVYKFISNEQKLILSIIFFVIVIYFINRNLSFLVGGYDYYADYISQTGSYKPFLIHLFILVTYIGSLKKKIYVDGILKLTFVCLLLGTVCLGLANREERAFLCFEFFDILAIPIIIYYLRNKLNKFLLTSLYFLLFFAIFILKSNTMSVTLGKI